ncbi:GMP reductase 1-like isoform X2 [Athalia rosae]|nr:GMP reductase 1-like isoform X2 [Athalia rosae]XP_048514524.1 GMP reductase 1-like isoform X2 [Athalia rosae]XP_048514525.1 GMP reductase 1-like isoform X2 [Athalia rosae]
MTFRHSKRTYNGIPLMASNMDSIGTFEMAKTLSKHGVFTAINKYNSIEGWKKFATENPECLHNVAVCSGIAEGDFKRLSTILTLIPELSFILIDVANGYAQSFVNYIKKVRHAFPNHTIAAGDVATAEITEELILAGADIVKIGIGPGSVCTTRTTTGVGFPQLSAVLECAEAAHTLNGFVIADGGCNCTGDVAKALGAGADFVMIGGMLSGHDQCLGEVIERDGKQLKIFYGSCSATAMNKFFGGVAKYRSVEGKTVEIPYRGDVEPTILEMLGGLRSTCTYVGASSVQELPLRTIFVRCNEVVNSIFGPS